MMTFVDVLCFIVTVPAFLFGLYGHIYGAEDTKKLLKKILKKIHCPLPYEWIYLILGVWLVFLGFYFGLKLFVFS